MKPKEWFYRIFVRNLYGNVVFGLSTWAFAIWFCWAVNGFHW